MFEKNITLQKSEGAMAPLAPPGSVGPGLVNLVIHHSKPATTNQLPYRAAVCYFLDRTVHCASETLTSSFTLVEPHQSAVERKASKTIIV